MIIKTRLLSTNEYKKLAKWIIENFPNDEKANKIAITFINLPPESLHDKNYSCHIPCSSKETLMAIKLLWT